MKIANVFYISYILNASYTNKQYSYIVFCVINKLLKDTEVYK